MCWGSLSPGQVSSSLPACCLLQQQQGQGKTPSCLPLNSGPPFWTEHLPALLLAAHCMSSSEKSSSCLTPGPSSSVSAEHPSSLPPALCSPGFHSTQSTFTLLLRQQVPMWSVFLLLWTGSYSLFIYLFFFPYCCFAAPLAWCGPLRGQAPLRGVLGCLPPAPMQIQTETPWDYSMVPDTGYFAVGPWVQILCCPKQTLKY